MAKRKVTVIGGSGFLGRNLVGRLTAAGDEVRIAVRDIEKAMPLKVAGDVGQVVPWPCDITNPDHVSSAVQGADAVVNLVGILYERGNRTFHRLHVEGAANVAKAAADAGVRSLVHVSALGADANSPAQYARTKRAAEEAVLGAFPDAVVLRPSVVFGPDDNFFNMFAGLTRLTPVLPVFGCPMLPKITLPGPDSSFGVDFYGDGGTKFQPVYVGDVAQAICNAMGRADARGKTFELGGPAVYSFKEVMDLLLKNIERRRILAPLPFIVAELEALFLELLPKPLLTRDQVALLRRDNVVSDGALGLADLGIQATAAEAILPTYLHRFRTPSRKDALTA